MLILLLCSSNERWMSNIQVAVAVCGYHKKNDIHILICYRFSTFVCSHVQHTAGWLQTQKISVFLCRIVVPEWKGQYGQDVTVLAEGSKLNRQKWAFQNLYPGSSCNIRVIYSCVPSFSLSFPISALHRSLSLSVCLSLPRVAIIKVFPVTSVARGSYRCPFSITQSRGSCWPATNWQTQACTLSQRAFGFRLHTRNTHDISRKTHRRWTLFW